ncbi:MAG: ATP-dependent helicase [Deltaproteobacteria bacterium]|nr:ATP-dependent helicase [Deltaproteobacteria bacterium]
MSLPPLSRSQSAAARAEARRLVILAGPGTGKTLTLTARIAFLLEAGADPGSIVALTFTQRAARELVRRLATHIGQRAIGVRAGTFHGLALRWLREHARTAGAPPSFSLLDRRDQLELLSSLSLPCAPSTFVEITSLLTLRSHPAASVFGVHFDADAIERALHERNVDADPAAFEPALIAYADKKRTLAALDFDDLLVGLHTLLTGPASEALRSSIRHVLVDEFQDVSALEAAIAESLGRRGDLTVVGDDAQSIYGFRGAKENALREFKDHPSTELVVLEETHRPSPEILAVAASALDLDRSVIPRKLVSLAPKGPRPMLVGCDSPEQEARFIAARSKELARLGVPFSSQAVLYRANRQSTPIELELARAQVPFEVRGSVGFFERAHVRAALAWLRLLCRPDDASAWRKVLAAMRGVGKQTLDEAILVATGQSLGKPRAREAVDRAFAKLSDFAELADRAGAPGVLAALAEAETDESARADLDSLAQSTPIDQPLDQLIDDLLALGADREEAARALTLSTIHQAKGLEWDAVFVAGLSDRSFPSSYSSELSEERRLFYVALTRARRYLAISGLRQAPSKFFLELEGRGELVDRIALAD